MVGSHGWLGAAQVGHHEIWQGGGDGIRGQGAAVLVQQ